MAKLRKTEDEVAQFAFFLTIEGLVTPPPGSLPRLYPTDLWTQAEIFNCVRRTFGRDAARWAASMRLFTIH